MKIFAQIQSLHDQETLYENLQKEKKLKSRLKELMHYRKNGITKLSEVDSESSKSKKEKSKIKEKDGSKKKGTWSSSRSTGLSRSGKNVRSGSSGVPSVETPNSACDTSDGELTDEGDVGDEIPQATSPTHPSSPPSTGSPSTTRAGLTSGRGTPILTGGRGTPLPATKVATKNISRANDFSKLPGYDLLSHKERQLCCSINMTPSNYILIKAAILKDHCSRQNGITVKNKYHGVEKSHRKKIIEFLATSGWITVP